MALQAIRYADGKLQLLDQRLLPHETVFLDVLTPQDAWQHIKDMVVRGAPAIGVTGALALAVHLISGGRGKQYTGVDAAVSDIGVTLDFLVTSRPTAVNLADSAAKLSAVAAQAAAAPDATPASVVGAVIAAAEGTLEQDVAANKAIGQAGAHALLAAVAARGRAAARPGGKLAVLTHCNTGSLATAGYGTALGVARALHEMGRLEMVYACETRPYNQGARLTAFELVHDGLPATLIVDSAAAALMAAGRVDAVIVGADRVVANGDTANKIGTYSHAVAAARHGLPFFVAAPTTTLDPALPEGGAIVIEQRPPEEITHFRGARVVVEGVGVWNPCFDVTPGSLVEGIITEAGVVPRDPTTGLHRVAAFMAEHATAAMTLASDPGTKGNTLDGASAALPRATSSVSALDAESVVAYLAARPELAARVGPAGSEGGWQVAEVGDGNINFVWLIKGPTGGVCLKQSLPFVRCVGESWPLTQDRARIEAEALRLQHALCPEHVPEVYLYDPAASIIIMQLLGPPLRVLRHALVAGESFDDLGQRLGSFLAATLFATSLFALDASAFALQRASYANPELCAITEQLIFTDPYHAAPLNRWTQPQLDTAVAELHSDASAKAAACELKRKFMTRAEALVHGDLHTGSVMVCEGAALVIDPEFAFVGPLSFDPAKVIGELLITYYASDGLEAAPGTSSRAQQRSWLLHTIVEVWDTFCKDFLRRWNEATASAKQGEVCPAQLLGTGMQGGPEALAHMQADYMAELFRDVVAFAGAIMIRRMVTIAHVVDMDSISDQDTRAACEGRALRFGRHLLVDGPSTYVDIQALVAAAAALRSKDGLPAET